MASNDIEICANCGREIPRSEQAYIFKGKVVCTECDKKLRKPGSGLDKERKKESVLCFFCGEEAADDESACPVSMCQVLRTEGTDFFKKLSIVLVGAIGGFQPGKHVLFRKRVVKVPRCARCKTVHDHRNIQETKLQDRGIKYGGSAGFLVGIVLAVYLCHTERVSLGGAFGLPILTTILGAVIGGIVGYLLGFKTSTTVPKAIKAEEHAKEFHGVKQMLAKEWEVGELPSGPEGAQFFEVPPEKEKEFMTSIDSGNHKHKH